MRNTRIIILILCMQMLQMLRDAHNLRVVDVATLFKFQQLMCRQSVVKRILQLKLWWIIIIWILISDEIVDSDEMGARFNKFCFRRNHIGTLLYVSKCNTGLNEIGQVVTMEPASRHTKNEFRNPWAWFRINVVKTNSNASSMFWGGFPKSVSVLCFFANSQDENLNGS